MRYNTSHVDLHLDVILDKVGKGKELDNKEKYFLENYSTLEKKDFMDYRMLSVFDTCIKIDSLLQNDFEVICNLCDRDGPLGLRIRQVNQLGDKSELVLADNSKLDLKDNILYDLKYEFRRWRYSLESGDEFVELALINKA